MKVFNYMVILALFLSITAFIPQDTNKSVMDCAGKAGPSAVYLKDFQVSLDAAVPDIKTPIFRQTIVLRGNNLYMFNVCNKKGEAVIRIYDSNRLLVSSFDPASGKIYEAIQFLCQKTGPYNIVITFKNGQAGECIGIMSHLKMSAGGKK